MIFRAIVAAMAAFTVSALLHTHVAYVGFGRGLYSAFAFFVLNGLGCTLESMLHLVESDRLSEAPEHVPALVTAVERMLTPAAA